MAQSISRKRIFSQLYQRFNGIMFGFFAQMASFRAVREQWPDLRDQMSRFVTEIGLDEEIPKDVENFEKRRGSLFSAALKVVDDLNHFKLAVGLGYSFVGLALGAEVMPRDSIEGGMSTLGLDPSFIDELIEGISRDERDRPVFDDMMTAGLKLAARLVETCSQEPETCFVAMPFHNPYPTYYHELYRPLLEEQGLQCVRAWGGMRNEAHHDLLLSLIDRCGWLFAELTDANPNVAYELGFATGCGKRTVAVMDTNPDRWVSWAIPGQPKKLSNLRGIAVLPYDSSESEWRKDFLDNWGPRYIDVARKIYTDSKALGRPRDSNFRGWLRRLFARD